MGRREDRQFRRRLRRLDRPRFVRFVAAIWGGRDRTVEVRGQRVVVAGAATGGERVLTVVGSYREALRTLAGPPDDADVVVTSLPAPVVRALRRRGMDVVGPAGLRERLRYGTDRDVRRRLEDRLLPAAPSVGRRAVLAGAGIGLGAVIAGGIAPRFGGKAATPGVRYVLERTGEDAGRTDDRRQQDDAREPRTTTRECGADPDGWLAGQVGTFLDWRGLGSSIERDGIPHTPGHYRDLTDQFRDAIGDVDTRPLVRARSVGVGAAVGDATRVRVPLTAVTRTDVAVFYEFTLVDTGGSCWRTLDAVVAGRVPPESASSGDV